MKSGPSIAVMLGGAPKLDGAKHYADDDSEAGDMSLSETKMRAEDAATALAAALEAKEPKKIVAAFCALTVLADHLAELEDSGEKDDDETSAEAPEEVEEG